MGKKNGFEKEAGSKNLILLYFEKGKNLIDAYIETFLREIQKAIKKRELQEKALYICF